MDKNEYDIYVDIANRCRGELYIGVVGPVRTGKSTFIKRFMEKLVVPNMEDEAAKMRLVDELPQSGGGRTISTTEPKFVPSKAAKIKISDEAWANVKLIDCVGYMVDEVKGHMENDEERMVHTPWLEQPIPFSLAAKIGTDKVINDHSNLGIVVTTDGSILDIPRENYEEAEDTTITTLKALNKPFVVLVNSVEPYSKRCEEVVNYIADKYQVTALAVNCDQLRREDILQIMEKALYEFPVSEIEFMLPAWVTSKKDNEILTGILKDIKNNIDGIDKLKDVKNNSFTFSNEYVNRFRINQMDLKDGNIQYGIDIESNLYHKMLSDITGADIEDDNDIIRIIQDFVGMKNEYDKFSDALSLVRDKGYSVVSPKKDEITLTAPELIRHGSKYGVKIKAVSPSIHLIKANIETEISPIVGSKEQADDLVDYINKLNGENQIWDTNIFGKTVEELVNDGITKKVLSIDDESQVKLQDTMEKIVNDINGGMVCIIL